MAYLNVVEIESALANLAAAYPAAAELITLPHLTHDGRMTHLLRVGTSGASDADGVLLLGGVHAREWVPPDALVSLAADLLEAHQLGTGLGYGGQQYSATQVQEVLENVNLYVFACVNPDGRQFSQTADALWRKNRRPHASGGSCVGVDLNRNFDFLWDHTAKFASNSGVNTSADPCNKTTYRGPAVASEPETQNVTWVLDTYPRIRWHVDVHAAVPVILFSWGSDENQTTRPAETFLAGAFDGVRGRPGDTAYGEFITQADLDTITDLSTRMKDAVKAVRGDDYAPGQAYGLYPTSGASDDYAYSRHFADPTKAKVFAFTIECGHSFQPASAEADAVIREVSSGLIALSLAAATSAAPPLPAAAQANSIALVRQSPGWASIPVASSNGDGSWTVTNGDASEFIAAWATTPGVRLVSGDFTGDGLTDIALVRQTPGWGSIPIASAHGDGSWTVTNGPAGPDFIPSWASAPGVRLVPGDFNGDGLTDIALVRQTPGWGSIPIASANGDGSWTITNGPAPDFITSWANAPGVRLVPGDFNGNGLTDIALVRQTPGWGSIPIAFAIGDGNWTITNGATGPDFIGSWASAPGVRLVPGDFNGNGMTDIALVRQTPGWGSIPIAFAIGDGNWTITNGAAGPDFIPSWASTPGVKLIPGDFNGNGLTDIALVRQTPGWSSIPIAFANGDGTWTITNGAAPDFIPTWANLPGVRLVPGDFNGNGLTDIALVRQTPGWGSIPIASANGDGTWTITNGAAPDFVPAWAPTPGVRLVPGSYR